MEPLSFWTMLLVVATIVIGVGTLFGFIRRNDLVTITDNLKRMEIEVDKKLNEAEFRRHEEREEAAIKTMIANNDAKFEKAQTQIERLNDKIDELMKFLMK